MTKIFILSIAYQQQKKHYLFRLREKLGLKVMQALKMENTSVTYAALDCLCCLMQPMHSNYELRQEQLNKSSLLSSVKFLEFLLETFCNHVVRNSYIFCSSDKLIKIWNFRFTTQEPWLFWQCWILWHMLYVTRTAKLRLANSLINCLKWWCKKLKRFIICFNTLPILLLKDLVSLWEH